MTICRRADIYIYGDECGSARHNCSSSHDRESNLADYMNTQEMRSRTLTGPQPPACVLNLLVDGFRVVGALIDAVELTRSATIRG